jgi:hypothetical protein
MRCKAAVFFSTLPKTKCFVTVCCEHLTLSFMVYGFSSRSRMATYSKSRKEEIIFYLQKKLPNFRWKLFAFQSIFFAFFGFRKWEKERSEIAINGIAQK